MLLLGFLQQASSIRFNVWLTAAITNSRCCRKLKQLQAYGAASLFNAKMELIELIYNSRSSYYYRHCIHPRIPQLAVMGHADSFSTLFTSEMMSKWLACMLACSFRLPTILEMEKDVLNWVGCTKMYKGKPLCWTCVQATNIWYNDQLCKDMGHNPRRKIGFLAEWFQPYSPADYGNM